MATLNIEGVGRVTVDDSFLKLSPEAQAKTVDEIVASARSSQTSAAPAAPAPAPTPAPQKQSGSLLKTIDDAVRGAADTLTFGYADEIAAGMDRLFGINTGKQGGPAPKSYDEALAAQRARDAEGGGARVVGQIAGGLLPITKGSQLAKAGLTKLGITPTAVKTGMVTGGTAAGLYGTGSSEGDIGDRLIEGAQAVPVGVALGAAAPVVADKVAKGLRVVNNKLDDAVNLVKGEVPVEKLSAGAQKILKEAGEDVTVVTPKAAKALEKMSENPTSVASDIRVRDLFLTEKAKVLAADPQRGVPDDVIFKNVGDKLKRMANETVDRLVKSGEIDAAAAKEVKAVVSRAARHNRAISGSMKDEELAAELARGFRTDDSIIEGLGLSRKAKDAILNTVKDLDTITYNSLKQNQGAVFQNLLGAGGRMAGGTVGAPGVGKAVGSTAGKLVDKVLFQQGTAPVLKRTVDRIADGLDEAGVKAGSTVSALEDLGTNAAKKLATKAAAEESAKKLMQERLNAQNIALARARAPYAEGTKLGDKASPQAVLVEAFEDATGIKHKPGMVQDVLKAIKKDENFGPAFSQEVDQAIKALGNKPGQIDNLTNLVRAIRAKAAEQQALGTLKVRSGQTVETGAGRVRNEKAYNAKVIENTIRDVMSKGE